MGAGHAGHPAAVRVRQLEERVIAAGLATDAELDATLARLYAHASPLNGSRIVARAWADPGYSARLLADGNAAAAELGFDTGHPGSGYRLKVVANTPGAHNMIVCTLCSCYPVSLLGPSPSWYKSLAYRSRAVREPRAVLAEFGLRLPADTQIVVWDASAENRFLVRPARPPGTDGLTEEELAAHANDGGPPGVAVDCGGHRESLRALAYLPRLLVVEHDRGGGPALLERRLQTDRAHRTSGYWPNSRATTAVTSS